MPQLLKSFMLPNILAHQPVKDHFSYDDLGKPTPMECTAAYRVGQSRAFMEGHFNQHIKIPALAAQADVSISHFFKLFKQDTGCAPLVYLTRLRVKRACALLTTTTLSIKLIAVNLGYKDPMYFSRVFKSLVGMAPRTYRRSKKNGSERDVRAGSKDNFSYFSKVK
jgi:AraC-like DNA-binding protein